MTNNISLPLSRFRKILLLGVGKASAPMMTAATDILRNFPLHGILILPKNQIIQSLDRRVHVFRAGHPIPDRDGLKAAQFVATALRNMTGDELLLCLISGGTSAMLPSPPVGVRLLDESSLTDRLLKSEASIHAINTVRRHISTLRGGQLVETCQASAILSFIISDVPRNYLPDIASGLTVEDPTTYGDAIQVLRFHGLWDDAPQRIKNHLSRGFRGLIPDTPKPGTRSFQRVHNVIIADNSTACKGARDALNANQVRASVLTSSAEIEAKQLGKFLATMAYERISGRGRHRSEAIIIGGETTVRVKGGGVGGRNQETVLWGAEGITNLERVVIAALGTDGVDGNSNAAGALADGGTTERAKKKRLDPKRFLVRNDSYRFFRGLNDNLVTGPTGTNVGDIYLMLSLS